MVVLFELRKLTACLEAKCPGLGKQEIMKLVHEAVIERGEVFKAFRACFFETFEEEDLCARVDLF